MYGRLRARHLAVGLGAAALAATLTATAVSAAPAAPTTAAERYGWGAPLPEWSDEFDYGSEADPAIPDRDKWRLAGGGPGKCWPGHSDNGRRCDVNTRVVGDVLRMTGEANGDTGWLASPYGRQYGRWEARVRSRATAPDNGRQYHPLLILWPDSNEHPEDGEYDYLENGAPGESCAEAFLHYPHPEGVPVQQEFVQKCGVDLSQWHNVAIEWTPDHLRGFIDGEEWFRFADGANADRDCIQCAPSMHQTIQLDNFHGDDLQSAVYEVDWARVYDLPYAPDDNESVR
ncbi:glycoside hydrolase family 16 protein [Streptomyces sp. KR55]|uniref:glycoside hydrolase family 16 protein n=1 Tax=Streptomyces sp. KR55 TaxID=3457425 RepID=UPI003FD19CA9